MPTTLLNDDGTASMATLLMSSHHAFRRDLACFAKALATSDTSRDAALASEWTQFRGGLHGHHTIEDTSIFPDLRARQAELAAVLDQLDADHKAIDPLLERGDRAFANLATERAAAREVIVSIGALLSAHLDREERAITPFLRDSKEFPVPPDESMIAMYADGFAWSGSGLAPAVLDKISAMLPAGLVSKLPAARERFDERCTRAWGYRHTGASMTSVPDPHG